MVVGFMVHPGPGISGSIWKPWSQLINDDFSLYDSFVEHEFGWKLFVYSAAHGYDGILDWPHGSLSWVSTMNAGGTY
jgi:hypothetical protein